MSPTRFVLRFCFASIEAILRCESANWVALLFCQAQDFFHARVNEITVTTALHSARIVAAVVAVTIVCNLLPMTASGARFPNAVEKTFVITGDAATSVATLLGLAGSGTSSVTLPIDKGVAWAVYLLKQDTKTPIYNGDGPPRFNHVTYSAAPVAKLTLA